MRVTVGPHDVRPAATGACVSCAVVRGDAEDRLLHSKFLIIDGLLSIVGSHNWSAGSYFQFDDLTFVLSGRTLARRLTSRFARLWDAGTASTQGPRARGRPGAWPHPARTVPCSHASRRRTSHPSGIAMDGLIRRTIARGRGARRAAAPLLLAAACRVADVPPSTRTADTTTASAPTPPTVAAPDDAAHPRRVLGLVALPGVFGRAACDTTTPVPIPIHARAGDATPIGRIEVATRWIQDPGGGCRGLEVVSRRGSVRVPLPTREMSYEEPGAIVVGLAANDWYRVQLDDTSSAWIRHLEPEHYRAIATLLVDALAYTTSAWDGRLAPEPGAPTAPVRVGADPSAERWVRVVAVRSQPGGPWARVEVLRESGCESGTPPPVVARGWLPLYGRGDSLVVWFASRGC